MKNIIKTFIYLAGITVIAWLLISYIQVIANNHVTGYNYSEWNFFVWLVSL